LGLFIAFEGGEGCGKSTQARILWSALGRQGVAAILTREPGGTSLGTEIRRSLKRVRQTPVSPEAELLLFVASRAQLIAEVVRPALEEGKTVICDRFSHSTLAYQGYGRGLALDTIETVSRLATQNLKPDIIVLLDLAPEEGLSRKGNLKDVFELQALSFHQRVREGYLEAATREPGRWLVVDARLPKTKITRIIWERVSQLLQRSC
jgi:dTMP kinase